MRLLIVALVICSARPAAAETRTERYATTVAVIDGIGLGLAVPGIVLITSDDTSTLGIVAASVGGALYLLGSPIAHYVKQDTKDKYYGSILLRVGALAVLGGIGAKIGETRCTEQDKTCDELVLGLGIGAGTGALAVSVVDIAFLAKRQVAVVPANGGAMVGIAGQF